MLVVYVKMPVDSIRQALFDLGWIPSRWAEWGQMEWLRFSDIDTATHITFMKLFEQFGDHKRTNVQ